MMRFHVGIAWLLVGCGGASKQSAQPEPASEPSPLEGHPAMALVGATVYDARAQSKACEAPRSGCPETSVDQDFLDKCRLGGFQVRQCGCEQVCTGNVMVKKKHYDAQGRAKDCAPEQTECTPPDTSAQFQDACSDAGNKLVVCGCEWLCAGPLK